MQRIDGCDETLVPAKANCDEDGKFYVGQQKFCSPLVDFSNLVKSLATLLRRVPTKNTARAVTTMGMKSTV